MKKYHKIQTIFKRDEDNNFKTLIEGDYSLPEFEFLKDNQWTFTEKVDGTNIRIVWNGFDISFKGKSDNADIPSFLLEQLENKFLPMKEKFKELFGDGFIEVEDRLEYREVCLYGEGYGNKIQKVGKLYRDDTDFVLFDIKIGHIWLQRNDIEDIAQSLDIDIVPIIGSGTLDDMIQSCKKGFNSIWGDFRAEGIVARPQTELLSRTGQRIITKLKCKDFK